MLSRLSSIRFNPRTPCGVRLVNGNGNNGQDVFQSTHSLRSATRYARSYPSYLSVSIHALLAECDESRLGDGHFQRGFNPRTPCGVRPHAQLCAEVHSGFNPRTPCGVRLLMWFGLVPKQSFNPRTPCGVRRTGKCSCVFPPRFQSTHSLRSATAPDHIHCYSTAQTILCANLPKKAIIT